MTSRRSEAPTAGGIEARCPYLNGTRDGAHRLLKVTLCSITEIPTNKMRAIIEFETCFSGRDMPGNSRRDVQESGCLHRAMQIGGEIAFLSNAVMVAPSREFSIFRHRYASRGSTQADADYPAKTGR